MRVAPTARLSEVLQWARDKDGVSDDVEEMCDTAARIRRLGLLGTSSHLGGGISSMAGATGEVASSGWFSRARLTPVVYVGLRLSDGR